MVWCCVVIIECVEARKEDDLQLAGPMNMTAAGGDEVSLENKASPGSPVYVSLSSKYFLLLPATQ